MRCHPFLTTVLLFGIGTVNAQGLGEIRGRVLDKNGQPLIGASVATMAADKVQGTTADLDGQFVLKPLSPGLYTVQISMMNFRTVEIPGVEVTADRANYIADVRMKDDNLMKGHEVIGYKRKLIEIDDPGRMSLLASEIAKLPVAKSPVQLISTQFAGVTASANGDGLHFRGSRTENMASFIDGVKVSGAVPRIPPRAISSISVYTGGLPARYGDVTGGVIVIETKTYSEMYEEARALELQREREVQPIEQPQ